MRIVELYRFAKWVASEVCQEDFEENAGVFAEVCCRKLHYLGIVKKDDENWIFNAEMEEGW